MLHFGNLAVSGIALVFMGQTALGQWVQWSTEDGGNGHWYQLTQPGTWNEAETQAIAQGGHLVTINDNAERIWIADNILTLPEIADDPLGMWIGFKQADDSTEVNEGWTWVGNPALCNWETGDPQCYVAWRGGEPNNNNSVEDETGAADEDYAVMYRTDGLWNDWGGPAEFTHGIIERDTPPPPVPAVSTWGLAVFALLIVATATVVMRRQQRAAN